MRHPWGRWTLVAVALAVTAAAVAWAVRLEGGVRGRRSDATLAATHARSVRAALFDVRRALAAMASPGQAAAGWSRQAATAIDAARDAITALSGLAQPTTPAPPALDVLDRLAEAERRIREHAVGGKPLMAADVAFGEALPHLDTLERQVLTLHDAVDEASGRDVAMLRDRQVMALAGALAALGLAALLLAPLPRSEAAIPPASDTEPVPDVLPAPTPEAPAVVPAPAVAAGVDSAPPRPVGIDLPALAAACNALATVGDAAGVPAALDRARVAVAASGLMLWVADTERRQLRVAAHAGYDARLVSRLGTVDVGDEVPTARAFATGAVVTTDARPGRPAAAALPVTGPSGVTGVLTVELEAAALESPADVAAALQIVAAQLATLVAADAAATSEAVG